MFESRSSAGPHINFCSAPLHVSRLFVVPTHSVVFDVQSRKLRVQGHALGAAVCLQGAFFLFRLGLCWGFDSRVPSLKEGILLAGTLLICYLVSYYKQQAILECVGSVSVATDIFIVALFSLLLGSFHIYGWFAWVSVPLYVSYIIIRKVLTWVFTPDDEDVANGGLNSKKKVKRPKIKVIRH